MPWTERTKRRLKLRDLDVLMAVIETGSMGKAAKRLGISQPGVSKAIVELEDALGVRLLDRSRRGIVPTPYGVALQRQGAAVFGELRQAVRHIDFIADPTKGEIRIGTTDPLAISIVSPVIDALSREHPNMSFHVTSGGSAELYSAVADRRVEFAVCRMIGRLPNDLAAEVLFHDAFAVMASAENPLTRKRKLDWADLVDEPWTLFPFDNVFGSVIAEAFRVSGLEPPRLTVAADIVHCSARNAGDRPFFDRSARLHGEAAAMGAVAEGAAGLADEFPHADRDHHAEGSQSDAAGPVVYRQAARLRAAAGRLIATKAPSSVIR